MNRVKDRDDFLRKLNAPPKGSASKVTPEEAARQMADLQAFAAAMGANPEAVAQGA